MNRFLDGLEGRNRGKPLLALWSGHGVPSHNGFLRLLTSDATRFHRHGLAVGDFLPACVATGSSQILLVLDTCHSGAGRGAGVDIAARMLEDAPPDADHAWVGVLASTLPAQQAIDGVFGAAFRKVVRNGPAAASQQLTWRNSRFVTGAQVAQAVTTDWDEEEHRPTFRSDGELSDLLPNPLWHYGRQAGIVEHLLLAARSGATKVEPPAFTGRRFEVDTVVGWVASRTPGLYVVTGLAGTGKSAVVGRVVSLSDPAERKRVLKLAPDLGHADPGEGAVAAHAHARGLTADRLAEALGNALVHRDVLPPSTTGKPYNAALLVGALQQHEGVPPVLVVDGLDEARDHAFAIADDLLTKLAGHACVVVASRDLPGPGDSPSLLDRLDPHGSRLDLSGPEALVRGQDAMGAYVTARLSDRSPVMDPGLVAEVFLDRSDPAESPFLLARIVTDQLRAAPVDTSAHRWEERVAGSLGEALDVDLAQVAPPDRVLPETMTPAAFGRLLLTALTWSFGRGFPTEEWATVAAALRPGLDLGPPDLVWALDQLGRYVAQDAEGEDGVYRVAHQSVADALRPAFVPTHAVMFDPGAEPVAKALLGRYRSLLDTGVVADQPTYLWRYAWQHAASTGEEGVARLRAMAGRAAGLRRDLALADLEVADRLAFWGERQRAVAPTEEAVTLRRAQAADNPGYLPNLAAALTNLGIRYAEVGRRGDAVAPTEEAVTIYRDLAVDNSGYLPNLAAALTNLGIRYAEVGRRGDAVAPTEEAVATCRDLAADNPGYLPNLAMALTNLGNHYAAVGRRVDAIAPTEQAVTTCRDLAVDNPGYLPDLARALTNLGNHYAAVGRRGDAIAPTEKAVTTYRDLAADNPGYLPNLATALTNLGNHYAEVGRRVDAIAPTEQAVTTCRDLAADNPGYLPDLARALTNLGIRYAEVGRRLDAVAPTEEAVDLRRAQAADNPGYLPDLAMALTNLGNCYAEVGRRVDAVAPTEEAVTAFRDLAADNPGYLPNLAAALTNLGIRYAEVGRPTDAVAPTEEAVTTFRDLAVDNPGYLPNLAAALTNLGNRYAEVGRRGDAVAPTEEAVATYRGLAVDDPGYLPDLASALNNLGNRYADVGWADETEPKWDEALAGLAPPSRAQLLYHRSRSASPGTVDPAGWLRRALDDAAGERALLSALHDEVRRHAGRAGFAAVWAADGDALPPWAFVDAAQLELARGWTATPSYAAERDYLAAHPELLTPAFDVVAGEALLSVSVEEAARYSTLRDHARQVGVDQAYRPRVQAELAATFAVGSAAEQRELLTSRRVELLDRGVRAELTQLAAIGNGDDEDGGAVSASPALALLTLAGHDLDESALDAIEQRDHVGDLHHRFAVEQPTDVQLALAELSHGAAALRGDAAATATASFYGACALAPDHLDSAKQWIAHAYAVDPEQRSVWVQTLADLSQRTPVLAQLIPALLTAAEPPADKPIAGDAG